MKGQDILSSINHESGMTVPENYFENFNRHMASELPQMPWESADPVVMPRSFWQKVRPYVYMAAMFAGIWCMMKTFDLMHSDSPLPVEKNAQLMSAINNDAFFNDYCTPAFSESDVIDELYNEGFDPSTMDSL
ncbi:MAG: hypothetical protein NC338_05830 [Firmicutes bacterium]|nr:hypothetical protein [Bacillota bacterium]MCM1400493.1 hypothetical protein [Bacteroides sp.]MCM1476879.1 hypothetical protein [Bacteroides sp.]